MAVGAVAETREAGGLGGKAGLDEFSWSGYTDEEDVIDMPGGQVYHREQLGIVVWVRSRHDAEQEPYVAFSDGSLVALRDTGSMRSRGLRVRERDVPLGPSVILYRWSDRGVRRFVHREPAVAPDMLLGKLGGVLRRYVELGDERWYEFLSVFCVATHLYSAFESFPYVFLHGMPGSGKSRTLKLLSLLACNVYPLVTPSEATMFRDSHEHGPCMAIDEIQSMVRDSNDTRVAVLNTGYQRIAAVARQEPVVGESGRSFMTVAFRTYSPKILAGTEELPSVLASRTIRIPLLRTNNLSVSSRILRETSEDWGEFRHFQHVFALAHAREVAEAYYNLDVLDRAGLSPRGRELWQPILAVAYVFEPYCKGLVESLVSLAQAAAGTERDGLDDWSVAVLEHLGCTVKTEAEYSAKELAWSVARRLGLNPEKVNAQRLGRTLRNFGLPPQGARRKKDGFYYTLDPAWVRGLLGRYGVSVPEDEPKPQVVVEEGDDTDGKELNPITDR